MTDYVELSAAFSPDGTKIVTVNAESTATIWDSATGDELMTLADHTATYPAGSAIAFSPDGAELVTADRSSSTPIVWDVSTGNQLTTLVGHTDDVSSVAFSPDGTKIVTASFDGTAIIWDATT